MWNQDNLQEEHPAAMQEWVNEERVTQAGLHLLPGTAGTLQTSLKGSTSSSSEAADVPLPPGLSVQGALEAIAEEQTKGCSVLSGLPASSSDTRAVQVVASQPTAPTKVRLENLDMVEDQQEMEDYNESLLDPRSDLDLASSTALLPRDAEMAEQPILIRRGGGGRPHDPHVRHLRGRGHERPRIRFVEDGIPQARRPRGLLR